MGQTRRSWKRAAEAIAATGRRAVTLDLRGHGESEWSPDGDNSYARISADRIAVARELRRPVLVGASLGGKIALAAAGYGEDVAAALVWPK